MRSGHAVSQLTTHYSRFKGQLAAIEKEIVGVGVTGPALREARAPEIQGLKDAMGHIAFCIRLFDPVWTPAHVKPIRSRRRGDPDKWGKLLNMAYDVLRPASQPLTSAEILDALWRASRITTAEKSDHRARLTTLMRGQEKVGAVRSHWGKPLRWSIIRAPGQE